MARAPKLLHCPDLVEDLDSVRIHSFNWIDLDRTFLSITICLRVSRLMNFNCHFHSLTATDSFKLIYCQMLVISISSMFCRLFLSKQCLLDVSNSWSTPVNTSNSISSDWTVLVFRDDGIDCLQLELLPAAIHICIINVRVTNSISLGEYRLSVSSILWLLTRSINSGKSRELLGILSSHRVHLVTALNNGCERHTVVVLWDVLRLVRLNSLSGDNGWCLP